MSLGRNKRGIEWSTLIEILLVIVATGFIIGIFSAAAGKADEKTAENLCRGFNALRFGINEKIGFSLAPRACKTIDKKDVPSKDYIGHVKGIREGAKAEVRDLMARCWWMWIEGNQRDMFSTSTLSIDEKCFICYTFLIDESVRTISYADFSNSLNEPYYAIDGTDRCAPGGQGGWCMDLCNEEFSREVPSNKCNQHESGLIEAGDTAIKGTSLEQLYKDPAASNGVSRKCCVSKSECVNKGGKCLDGPLGVYTIYYKNWKCDKGGCYIQPAKSASYLDYIQGTKGVNGGAGKVLFGDDAGINPNTKYAITFLSPGREWNPATMIGLATTGTTLYWTGGIIVTGIATGGVSIATVVAATGLTAASGYFTSQYTGSVNDINYIMVSKYDTVKNHCAVETGVGER